MRKRELRTESDVLQNLEKYRGRKQKVYSVYTDSNVNSHDFNHILSLSICQGGGRPNFLTLFPGACILLLLFTSLEDIPEWTKHDCY